MNNPKLLYAGAGLLAVALISIGTLFKMSGGNNKEIKVASQTASLSNVLNNINIPIETIGARDIGSSGQVGASWPGEILSTGNILVYPPREGTIVEWTVRIGQWVSQGTTLGKLSAAPLTTERTMALADQIKDLIRAQTTELVNPQLKDAEVLLATAERDEAKTIVQARRSRVNALINRFLFEYIVKITGAINPHTSISLRPKLTIGSSDSQAQNDFEPAAWRLRSAIKDPDVVPEDIVAKFFQVTQRLVSASIAGNIGQESLSDAELISLRNLIATDWIEYVKELGEYHEAKATLGVKEAQLASKIVEREKTQEVARGETKGVEAGYREIQAGFLNRAIVASRSGKISAIFKNVGDFVTNDTFVASLTTNSASDRFVRFRIPGNITPPKAGETLTVIRPGFPMDGKKIKIVGVGLSLDSNGSFLADADFADPVDWPVHASVRVLAPEANTPVIKLSSVWWSENEAPNVWIVSETGRISAKKLKLGRMLGASIEVYEGLKNGDRYISSPNPDIRENMLLEEIIGVPSLKNSGENPAKKSGGNEHEGMNMDEH